MPKREVTFLSLQNSPFYAPDSLTFWMIVNVSKLDLGCGEGKTYLTLGEALAIFIGTWIL